MVPTKINAQTKMQIPALISYEKGILFACQREKWVKSVNWIQMEIMELDVLGLLNHRPKKITSIQNTSLWCLCELWHSIKEKYPKISGWRLTFYNFYLTDGFTAMQFLWKKWKFFSMVQKNWFRLKMQCLCVAQTMGCPVTKKNMYHSMWGDSSF